MVDREIEIVETEDIKHRFLTRDEWDDWSANQAKRGQPPGILRVVKNKGDILTLPAAQAQTYGISQGMALSIPEAMGKMNAPKARIEVAGPTVTERLSIYLGHPLLLVLLVVVAIIALIWEFKHPGTMVGFGVFGLALGLFFWLAIFGDTAGPVELGLFAMGVILLGCEIFVFPGFGIPGLIGIACVLFSIISAFIPSGTFFAPFQGESGNPFATELFFDSLKYASLALLAVVGFFVLLFTGGIRLPGYSRLALHAKVDPDSLPFPGGDKLPDPPVRPAAPAPRRPAKPPQPPPGKSALAALVGRAALAETTLRPAGKIRIEDRTYDANTEGTFIAQGTQVRILAVRENGFLVREWEDETPGNGQKEAGPANPGPLEESNGLAGKV
jgi:membrane-bound serine protease (ClpP class)